MTTKVKHIHLPIWVRETLRNWIDKDNPGETKEMMEALTFKAIHGIMKVRNIKKEIVKCMEDNVLDDQVQPLYAVYGWLVFQILEDKKKDN